jgi:hypothetical protein
MATHFAVVIGIEAYNTPNYRLPGAAAKAVRMAEWLVRAGGVSPENLILVLKPVTGQSIPDDWDHREASQAGIKLALREIVRRSSGDDGVGMGDRLYFCYVGHGLAARVDFDDRDALVAPEFSPEDSEGTTLTTESVRQYFQGSKFREQFFIFDSCRDVPFSQELRLGHMEPRPRVPGVQQFAFHATSPGKKAVASDMWFTEVLRTGLGGASTAKVWDPSRERYLVRVGRLFEYVLRVYVEKQRQLGRSEDDELYQTPRLENAQGVAGLAPDPVLVELEQVAPVPLTVALQPNDAIKEAAISVSDGDTSQRRGPLTEVKPVEFSLPPRSYYLKVSSKGWKPAKLKWSVELYDPRTETLAVLRVAAGVPGGAVGETAQGTLETISPTSFGLEVPKALQAQVTVTSLDPLATLELADAGGTTIKTGQGRLVSGDLKEGFYRARLHTPEGATVEQLLHLEAGETEAVSLQAPALPRSRLFRELIRLVGPGSEAADPHPHLAGVLAGAACPSGWDHRAGRHTKDPVLDPPAERWRSASAGLQVLLADELHPPEVALEYLAQLRFRAWPWKEQVPDAQAPELSTHLAGLAGFEQVGRPGAYWLAVERPGEKPILFALCLPEHRLCQLVFQLDAEARIRVFQFLPGLAADAAPEATVTRRLAQTQRFWMRGRLDHTYVSAEALVQALQDDRAAEPAAACLGIYLLLEAGRPGEADAATEKLIARFPGVPDGYVLRAASLERAGAAGARDAYAASLEHGYPILGPLVDWLADRAHRFQLDQQEVPLLRQMAERRVPSVLWSAWTSDPLQTGKPFEGPADGDR